MFFEIPYWACKQGISLCSHNAVELVIASDDLYDISTIWVGIELDFSVDNTFEVAFVIENSGEIFSVLNSFIIMLFIL